MKIDFTGVSDADLRGLRGQLVQVEGGRKHPLFDLVHALLASISREALATLEDQNVEVPEGRARYQRAQGVRQTVKRMQGAGYDLGLVGQLDDELARRDRERGARR